MTYKDHPKRPLAFSESRPVGGREIHPPAYKKPAKFSKIMEIALLAVERMSLGKKSIH